MKGCIVTEDGNRLEISDLGSRSRGIVLSMYRKQRRSTAASLFSHVQSRFLHQAIQNTVVKLSDELNVTE